MSGITPLLDTLLHQVLGPKGDISAQKNLNQPVRNVEAGEGPRALQSDSRLDARPNSQAHATQPQLRTGAQGHSSYQQFQPLTSAPSSSQIALSGAGRAIADVLLQYPAPSSTIRAVGPLLTAGEPLTPSLLNERLDNSIRNSGVFYETTLGKWLRGEANVAQLRAQPQMQFYVQAETAGERFVPGTIPEPVQPLVRQQLEMLSTPVLRWEGDVWQGIFMALFLQPAIFEQRHAGGENSQAEGEQQKSWRSELQLSVRGLGDLGVSVHLQEKKLHLTFVANDGIIERLAIKESILKDRLRKLGLTEVLVESRTPENEDSQGGASE